METPEVSPETKEPEKKEKGIADYLGQFAGAPSQDMIEAWKRKHGEVFCSGLSESELFIWRPITRGEFVQLQMELANAEKPVSQLEVEEQVVRKCMLWMSPPADASLTNKAGTLTTLHEQLMQNSNFTDPRLAAALVIKL